MNMIPPFIDYETVALIQNAYNKLSKPDSGKFIYEYNINEITEYN